MLVFILLKRVNGLNAVLVLPARSDNVCMDKVFV